MEIFKYLHPCTCNVNIAYNNDKLLEHQISALAVISSKPINQ